MARLQGYDPLCCPNGARLVDPPPQRRNVTRTPVAPATFTRGEVLGYSEA